MKSIRGALLFTAAFIVTIIYVLIRGGVLSGVVDGIVGDSGDKIASDDDACVDDNDENGDDTGESEAEPRYRCYKIVNNLQDKETYNQYLNSKLCWWFKRDTEHGPSGCDDTVNIGEFGGYYLDLSKTAAESEKVLYLTFDCGYENGYTEQILDVLKKHNVPACFFVTKTYIRDNIDLVKRMKEEGHQVGNHTITHPSLPERSFEEIVQEITGTEEYMKEATGFSMDPYLRPPRGEYSARTLAITHDLGYKTIFWSIAYLDYDVNKQPGASYVIEHFNKYHHNGAIILMHNVSSSNAAALDNVLTNMKAQGYRFASLNELK